MILVDTSVWVDHLRAGDVHLGLLLERNIVLTHDFVIGEIACGTLKNRQNILSFLGYLPRCEQANPEEVLFFIEQHRLMGRGAGYIDVCLLAAASLSSSQLWTRDRRLSTIAAGLGCAYSAPR